MSSALPQTLPQSMNAAVYRGPRKLDVAEIPVPTPEADEVLVQVSHCGVCGTDLHMMIEGLGAPGNVGGHEYSGVIAALGSDVEDWALGDRVAIDPNQPSCGLCEYCRAGRVVLCTERSHAGSSPRTGAFAQFTQVRARQLLRVPDALSLRDAALMEPLAVALHGISLSEIRPGGRALVIGFGPIGALSLLGLRARGVERVGVVEPAPTRRERARQLGADVALRPEELVWPQTVFDVHDDACDAVLECSGKEKAARRGLAQLKRGGTMVLVGSGIESPVLDTSRMILNELTVRGSYNYDPDGLREALDLMASGAVRPADVLEPRDVPLVGLQDALEGLAAGEIAGKVLIAPEGGTR